MIKKVSLVFTTLALLALPLTALGQDATPAESEEPTLQETPAESVGLPSEIANMESEGFTINPTRPDPNNRSNFSFEIGPGDELHDSVILKNLSSEASTFYVYGADSALSAQGTPAYKTRMDTGNGEGKWIQFEESEIVLQGGEQRELSFTLAVPENTELGDYRVGIAMEKTKQDVNNPNVTIATRLVLRTDIKVTNNPAPQPIVEVDKTWQNYYFWISLLLFVVSLTTLIWITFQESKEKAKNADSSKSSASTALKKSTSRKKSTAKKTPSRKSTGRKTTKKKPARKKST